MRKGNKFSQDKYTAKYMVPYNCQTFGFHQVITIGITHLLLCCLNIKNKFLMSLKEILKVLKVNYATYSRVYLKPRAIALGEQQLNVNNCAIQTNTKGVTPGSQL